MNNRCHFRIAERGLTLLEVLIATAIVALLGVAIQQYNSQLNFNIQLLQKRQLAQITANNQLVNMRLLKYDELDNREGTEQQLGHSFRWSIAVSKVSELEMKRLDVEVYDALNQQLLQKLNGFIAKNE
jgi:general secretion pathway protein I